MTHLFILNRFAGTKDNTASLEQKIHALDTTDEVIVEYTSCRGDATAIARRYAEQKSPLRVYACGGDGTANEALTGLWGHAGCALGIIPIGTGNDFVRSLGCDSDAFLDVQKMIDGTTVRVDILTCGEHLGLNVISVGYDCEVADCAQKIKRLPLMNGSLAYKLAIVYCLFTKRKHTFTPVADGEAVTLMDGDKTQMLCVAANGMFYGGGIKCTPQARLDDGNIDFMSIPTVSVPRFAALLSTFVQGEHIDNPKLPFVVHKKCRSMQFIDDKPLKIGIDGEMFEMVDPKVKILPSAFDIILPV